MAQASSSHAYEWLLDALAKNGPGVLLPPKPAREAPPDFQADLVRPDDLLTLHVAGYNLKVVAGEGGPELDRIDAARDAFLVVTFPPQNIAETAYFLASQGARHISGQTLHVNGGAHTTR